MTFEFATATRILLGRGRAAELPALCGVYGRRVLMVAGSDPSRWHSQIEALQASGCDVTLFQVRGEPTTTLVEQGRRLAKEINAEVVVGLGGGAVVDAGKAIAAMAAQPNDLLDYLEVVGEGQALDEVPLPYVAVPTTAGTGAEVTKNAVIGVPEHRVKVSLRHPKMLPKVALVDPELAVGLSPTQTAASGMDALTQLLEPLVCTRANPMTDALCREGIPRVIRSLEKAVTDGADVEAREDLAIGALFSGMALANAGLGAVHGFAAPIGGMFPAPHGAVCARLLAPVWATNARRVTETGNLQARGRFEEAARLLTGRSDATAMDASTFLEDLCQRLEIAGLSAYGIAESDLDEVALKAAKASSMKANPVELSQDDLVAILAAAL